MDENWVRQVLGTALGEEPPIGPVARNSLRAGIRLRRRLRMRRAAGGAAAVVVAAAVIPAAAGVFGNTSAGPRTAATPPVPRVPAVPTGTAYVITSGAGTVTPIDLATNTAGKPIDVSGEPIAMAVTPDGKTAYVASGAANSGREPTMAQTVTPVDLTTSTPGKPISLADPPQAIAVAPDGKTAYVIDGFPSRTVTPIDLATDKPGKPVTLSEPPYEIAMAPDGMTAYLIVAVGADYAVRPRNLYYFAPFDLATSKLGKRIKLNSGQPEAIAIAPDGKTAYVVGQSSRTVITVTPIDLRTLKTGKLINFSTKPWPKNYYGSPLAIAVAPDGATAYVTNGIASTVTPINLATGTPGKPIRLSGKPGGDAIAISSNGAAAYVANQPSSTVTPIDLTTNRPEKPIKIVSGWDSGFEAIVTVP
jgi:DNA-binding beta-propeller fold protein YncE